MSRNRCDNIFSKGGLFVLLLLLAGKLLGQQGITTTPSMVNDTILLCSSGSTAVSFSINNPPANNYIWSFPGGSPATAVGSGPHSVNFSAGTHQISVISYQGANARDTNTATIIVGDPTNLIFLPSDTLFCASDAAYAINGTAPGGGYFTGPGIVNNNFDPALAGAGVHKITYHYMNGSCHDTISRLFNVMNTPNATLTSQGTPIVFNGQLTYSRCVPASSTFFFSSSTDTNTYTSYSINFGDGSAPQSGSAFPYPSVSHSYPGIGIYKVILTLFGANGCPDTDTITIFYGSNPSVGLSITGNNVKCLPDDSTGITFWFPISDFQTNPPGTIYVVEVNDGTPPQIYTHPPPDSVSHIFYEPSCGYNTANFNNAFQVKITAQTPCTPHSLATVEPIYISDPPTAAFEVQPRVCLGQSVDIDDQSWGSQNALTGCDTNVTLIWQIFPSTYNVNSGYQGSMNGDPNPINWSSGTSNLNVSFTKSGYYTIRQFVGNQAGCKIDTVEQVICVDSIPPPDFAMTSDTFCAPDTVRAHFLNNLISLCDTTGLQWNISPSTGHTLISGATDSLLQAYFYASGDYTVTVTSSNSCGTSSSSHIIRVQNDPTVFMPPDQAYCGVQSVDFSQNPLIPDKYDSLAPLTYDWEILPTGWNFIGGTGTTSEFPEIDFTTYGEYTVIHTVTNACGSASDTMKLSFHEFPELDSIPDTLVCYNSDFYQTATASGGLPPYSYSWGVVPSANQNNGDSIFVNNIKSSKTYFFIVTDSLGCSDSVFFNVNVTPPLTADAGPDADICPTDSIVLQGAASGGAAPYTYQWSPSADLINPNSQNPVRIPSATSQTYTLTVTDSMGCTAEDEVNITVFPLINLDAGPDLTFCYDSILHTLSGQSHTGGTWSGPGITGNIFDPISAGLGIHTIYYNYSDAGNCPYTDSLQITVINIPQAAFSINNTSGCTALNVEIYDSSTAGVTHEWFINDSLASTAQNPIFNFVNLSNDRDTVITVKLVIAAGSGCTDTVTHTVTVYPKPLADFSLPASVCANNSIQVSQNSIYKDSATYQWTVSGSGVQISNDTVAEPYFAFPDNQSGSDSVYTITLIIRSGDGCLDTLSRDITIYSRPTAAFSLPANACSPIQLSPVDSSTGNGLIYNWMINPPVPISGGNTPAPVFDFPLSSNDSVVYDVYLTVIDSNGCLDTTKGKYTVYPVPTAAFTPSAVDSCGPLTVIFSNQSASNLLGQGLEDLNFQWNFGNGQTSTDSVPVITFVNNGIRDTSYVVTLMVTNEFGCTDTVSDTITIHPDSRAEILAAYSVDCAPFTIDSSVVNAIQYPFANDLYIWQVIDLNGKVLSIDTGLFDLNYTLLLDGDSINLRLITTSIYGCKSDTAEVLFYTIRDPFASFVMFPDSGCSPLTVVLSDSSTPGVSHEWYLNDNLFSTTKNPVLTLVNNSNTTDSTVIIKLIVNASSGCRDSISKSVTIYPKPLADFSMAANICPGDSITVINNSTGKGSLTHLWTVNSSAVVISNDTLPVPTLIFPDNQSGFDSVYTVTLLISTGDGCTDTASQNITVFSRPLADFALPAASCAPVSFSPVNNSLGNNLKYTWNVNPAINVQGANSSSPVFTFPVSTNDSVVYTIELLLNDSINGCVDSLTKTYTVYPKPTAGFTVSTRDSCGPFTLTFTNTSTSNQSGMSRSDMSFLWDFHNGQTSTDSVPTVTFTNNGFNDTTYTITLIASNAFGCSDTITDSITVHPNPKASITLLSQGHCAPFTIDTAAITHTHYPGANSTYTWHILDPVTRNILQTYSHADSISYELLNPGDSIILRLIADSPFNCKSDTIENLIYTIGKAFPGFMASSNEGCSPLNVSFTDTVPGFTAWYWYVNGQLVSTIQNPNLTFTNSSYTVDSVYEVEMVAISGFGCNDTVSQNITVFANVDAGWSVANNCISDTTSFFNTTQSIHPITSWNWDFGNGNTDTSQNPEYQYPNPGVYIVNLTATNIHGCSGIYSDTVTIYARPVADFTSAGSCGADTACIDQTFSFTDASTIQVPGGNITQWSWDIDADGTIDYTAQNPSHTFTTTGLVPVRLIVESQFGCADTIDRNIFINEAPTAAFNIDSIPECGPYTASVTDSSYGMIDNYLWEVYVKDSAGNRTVIYTSNLPNPNPLPTFQPNYGADTTYYISATVSNCCGSSTFTDSLTLKSMPIAYTIPSTYSGCTPLNVAFQLDGLVHGRPNFLIMNYGDGTIDTIYRFYQINPVGDTIWVWGQQNHTFTNPNLQDTTFNVQLTAVNNCGDSTVSLGIIVHPNNVQAFISATPTQGCAPLTVTLMDLSFGGNSTTWCLDYDTLSGTCNQPTAMGDSIVYTYTTPGTYVVAQYVNDGCSADTAYKVITVHPAPAAAFSHSGSVCEDDFINFTNLSNTGAGTGAINGYVWDFGDGQTSFLQNPSHYYSDPGIYTVCLAVITSNGCMDSICQMVTVYDKPDVKFSAENACLNQQPVAFFDSTTVQSGQIISTLWKFGDGNTSVAQNPLHTYAAAGTYTVTLIHSSTYGCVDSSSMVLNIFETATADFDIIRSFGKNCGAPQNVDFHNTSTNAAGYYWDFDYYGQRGVNTSTLVDPSFIFYKTGVYSVLLVATNANGCSDSIIRDVVVWPFPVAGFEGDNFAGCAPLTVNFQDTSYYFFNGPGGVVQWQWDFGDGNYSAGSPNVSHTYEKPGIYTVSLRVETDGGCMDSIAYTNYIEVFPTPVADFTYNDVNSKTFDFTNTTKHITPGTSFYWTFGDGTFSREKDPQHIYNVDLFETDYTFEVCLVTKSSYGCGDTICQDLNLKGYLLFTPNAFAPDLIGAGAANYFLPAGHSMETYNLKIFDEWGNIIFESTSLDENGVPNEPWYGKHAQHGTDLPMGAYVWKIEAVFNDGTTWEGKQYGNKRKNVGTVTLIR